MGFFILKREVIERLLETKIRDIIHELCPMMKIEKTMPIEMFIDTVKKHGVDAAVVVEKKDRIVGIITRLDLLKIFRTDVPYRLRVLAAPSPSRVERVTVGEIMSRNPVMIKETAKIRDAIDLMNRYKISHLIIIDEKGKPRAIFSRRYLLKKIFGIEEH